MQFNASYASYELTTLAFHTIGYISSSRQVVIDYLSQDNLNLVSVDVQLQQQFSRSSTSAFFSSFCPLQAVALPTDMKSRLVNALLDYIANFPWHAREQSPSKENNSSHTANSTTLKPAMYLQLRRYCIQVQSPLIYGCKFGYWFIWSEWTLPKYSFPHLPRVFHPDYLTFTHLS